MKAKKLGKQLAQLKRMLQRASGKHAVQVGVVEGNLVITHGPTYGCVARRDVHHNNGAEAPSVSVHRITGGTNIIGSQGAVTASPEHVTGECAACAAGRSMRPRG